VGRAQCRILKTQTTTKDEDNAETLIHSHLDCWGGGRCPFYKAPARDLGQWEGVDPAQREWFDGLMQPDNPNRRCCGLADAYWADSYEVKDNQYIAIIADERDDEPLRRPHIENGRRFVVPNSKIKWDSGNPTGHGIIFIGVGLEIHCYLPPGGG
jgi:hypothetical protein